MYEVYTVADHFAFTNRPSDAFVFITTHANWVNLGFNFGLLLGDLDGLLCGDGKFIRHIRIAEEADLEAPGIRRLVLAAMAEAEPGQGEVAKPCTVVRRMADTSRKRAAPKRR